MCQTGLNLFAAGKFGDVSFDTQPEAGAPGIAVGQGKAAHPVHELIARRIAERSKPGKRNDDFKLALAIEGGGMRGVIPASMAAAIDHHGLTECFDLVAGTSAGAATGAALLGGVAAGGCSAYWDELATRAFINPFKLLIGRPAFNPAYSLGLDTVALDAGRHGRAIENPIPLYCVALDVDSCEAVGLTGFENREELEGGLLASGRIPWIGGEPVEFRGRRWVDGGIAEPLPFPTAIKAGATHVLVLQSRPEGVPRSAPGVAERMIKRKLHRLNPELAVLYESRIDDYERDTAEVAHKSTTPSQAPHMLGWRLPAGSPMVGQLSRDQASLRAASDAAEQYSNRQIAAIMAGKVI